MKIETVELSEVEFVEVDGGWEKKVVSTKRHPAFLTNAAIKRGYDMGILESSLFEDLLKIKGLEILSKEQIEGVDEEKQASEFMEVLDEQRMQSVIYLGVLGANKNLGLTFDEFLELYHYQLTDTTKIYANLIVGLLAGNNEFATALQKETKKITKPSSQTGQKKKKHRR
ncbi:hypothetical protein [Metasolibacillus meyeri]|uniref:hypothetical protein n=1 Tax=Metasolibacillus meyeri TaxID=1071052 RepID=UPI000D322A40|nr:hypothetical protein [Metasolibacillus meyeri]